MMRKISLQTQIIVTLIIALFIPSVLLALIQAREERADQIETYHKQSLAIGSALESMFGILDSTITTLSTGESGITSQQMASVLPQFTSEFGRSISVITQENPDIVFLTLMNSEELIIFHTDPSLQMQPGSTVGLALDKLSPSGMKRAKIAGYDEVYLTRYPLKTTDWLPISHLELIVAVDASAIDQSVRSHIFFNEITTLGVLLLAVLAVIILLRRSVLAPLYAIRRGVRLLSTEQLEHRIPEQGSRELRAITAQINAMAGNIQESQQALEALYKDIENRTRSHSRDLEIAADIARTATRSYNIDDLMRQTVEQIRERYNAIYHAQIFLIDNLGEYAILVQSTGEAGQHLLALGHRLAVGSNSVIGHVTVKNEPVIASNTQTGNVPWQPNPLLPTTRAEMALPLSLGQEVIGALDVQSERSDVFTDDMVQVLSVLADQIAIAIQNARLLADSERRLAEIDRLNRQLTRSAWREFISEQNERTELGYAYDQVQTLALTEAPATSGEQVVATDIRVRGEVVGTLSASLAENTDLSTGGRHLLEAVAERVALALENARLFRRTETALAETERLYETARAISSTSELNTIYQMIVDQLQVVPSVDTIEILIAGPDPMLAQYLENAFSWNRQALDAAPTTSERLSVMPLNYTTEEMLPTSIPVTYSNVNQELAPEHPLKTRFDTLQTRAAVLAPLNAGGRWFGLLVCSSMQTVEFESTFVTFAGALADQLAIAIDNRRLFDEVQIEARRARALAEAGQLASQIGGDFESGLQNLFEAVSGPGGYDRWWFGLLTPDQALLRRVTASDDMLATPAEINLNRDENALAEAARIAEIVLINDPTDHPAVNEQTDAALLHTWGKHIAMPVRIGGELVGVLQVGRRLDAPSLDERDIQLAATLASQVAIATQNQRLFEQAESQRQSLQTIVDSMPTGILVVDRANNIVLSNQALRELLGPDLVTGADHQPQSYPVIRSGTNEPYPADDWPLRRAFELESPTTQDDMIIEHPQLGTISVLVQAVPIIDQRGQVTSVVGAFQDITELQELERALQDSLRETTLLYEASRSISRATNTDNLVQTAIWQMSTLIPDQTYVFLEGEDGRVVLANSQPGDLANHFAVTDFAPFLQDEVQLVQAATARAPISDNLNRLDVQSLSSFPMTIRSHINGWLVVAFRAPIELSTEQRRFMTTLADQAAITLENQRLLRSTERALQNTAMLYRASRSIADTQDPSDILLAFARLTPASQTNHAALYLQQDAQAGARSATVTLDGLWGDNPAADELNTRYLTEEFVYWNEMSAANLLHVADINQAELLSPAARAALNQLGASSATFIPLKVSERLIGMILISLSQRHSPSENDLQVYESLADQAAVSIENTRLYEQTQRRARQLVTVSEISRSVTSILELEVLLPRVVNVIKESFEYDHAQIFLISDDGAQANLVASTGEAGERLLEFRHSLPVGSQSVIGQVTATRQPQIALDTADARFVHRPNPLLPHTRSEMALPLIARDHIVGALDVQSNRARAFRDQDIQMLSSLADTVAVAIDNARLYELSQQRAAEMAFLFQVTTAATTSPDLEQALEQAVATLREMMGVANASIFLPDEAGQYMIRGADPQAARETSEYSASSIERSLVGWVARHNEAVIINDFDDDPRQLPGNELAKAAIAVPMRTAGELVGVLVVESHEANTFTDDDLRLLQALTGSLAAILQNTRLLREMQIANERLLEVDRLKTNFLAAMSHELRTPLNSIIGFSRVILKGIDGPLTEPQEQDLNTIYESGKHLLGLVNDILDQAKIEAGKMELSFSYFKMQDVVKGVMSSAVGLTRDKPIHLYTEIAEDLPDAYGDEFRTRQILLNLVSNASKFTKEGRITVNVYELYRNEQQYIRVDVEDTGIGIAEKDMPLLFEAFQQVDNSLTRSVEGTGMGLPLAKSLTELQHGWIDVNSEPGVGSTFSIVIPTAPMATGEEDDDGDISELDASPAEQATVSPIENKNGQQVEEPAKRSETPPPPVPVSVQPEPMNPPIAEDMPELELPQGPPRVVLAVDDDMEVINLYQRYLLGTGYEVLGISRPVDVERMAHTYLPSVILLDVVMPTRDGWDVLASLKQDPVTSKIPVIICSIEGDIERGLAAGAADYLTKPFAKDQLIDAVHRADQRNSQQLPHILLVDDQPDSVRLFREALESDRHYRITQVMTGQAALAALEDSPPVDLVILDLRMPELDGFQVLQAMRANANTAHIPVLVLTAEDINSAERSALESLPIYRKDDLDEAGLLHSIAAHLNPSQEKN